MITETRLSTDNTMEKAEEEGLDIYIYIIYAFYKVEDDGV